MSEYQFVHFLAIDRPLNEEELKFMRHQSTRAEISQWEFTNEYHFGDFHGSADEMLRRGYDVHLHYANFGIRRLMIRLPAGLPCDLRVFGAFEVDGLMWKADKRGKGGILDIDPEGDADSYEEECYDVAPMLPSLAPVRELLINGDLRPLYIAWLACNRDEEWLEPPVPAGLGKLPRALRHMAKFYEVSEDLIAAAAERSPSPPSTPDAAETLTRWIAGRSKDDLQSLVQQLLGSDATAARAEILSRIRDEAGATTWPTAEPTRTLGELREAAKGLHGQRLQRKEKAQEASRRKLLAAMAAAPEKTVTEVKRLLRDRSLSSYEEAARELTDLREALGQEHGPTKVREIAEELRRENRGRNQLIGVLRRHHLLD